MISLLEKEFLNPQNAGKMQSNKVSTSVVLGSPQIKAVIRLELEVKDNMIVSVKFKAYGFAAIACMSWLTQKIKGASLEEAMRLESMTISQELDIPSMKLYNCFLAIDSLQLAIDKLVSRS